MSNGPFRAILDRSSKHFVRWLVTDPVEPELCHRCYPGTEGAKNSTLDCNCIIRNVGFGFRGISLRYESQL